MGATRPRKGRFGVAGIALAVAAVLLVAGLWVALARSWPRAADRPDFAKTDWVGSEQCQECHEDRHQSWHQTYHRTMTQEASAASVQGRFDGRDLRYEGGWAKPVVRDGRYFFDYFDPTSGAPLTSVEVRRTVGSHVYQQYLGEYDGNYYRLHYLWHIQDQRWVHMNGAFLHADGLAFDAQIALWNQNCIFCHNTGPRPGVQNLAELQQRLARGEAVDVTRDARYRSDVAELGISCESCHAPGAEHVRLNQNPLRRWLLSLTGIHDASIVQPQRLAVEESVSVCGQCHGQRVPKVPDQIAVWMDRGPSFRAGDRLSDHVVPVDVTMRPPGNHDPLLYARRFWADGTPRLSAYEWQGMTLSACHESEQLTCLNCHSMHAGTRADMLSERGAGDTACIACHQHYRADRARQEHTQHAPGSPGSACVDCHMPKQVYGVMKIQRAHRITRPDPARSALSGAPNACLNCHAERTLDWLRETMRERWPEADLGVDGGLRLAGSPAESSQSALRVALFAGDAMQRAIAAEQAGDPGHGRPGHVTRQWLPELVLAMHDRYPAVRRFAQKSLLAILSEHDAHVGAADSLNDRRSEADPPDVNTAALRAALELFDFQADAPQRARWLADVESLIGSERMTQVRAEVASLIKQGEARQHDIEIGE